MSKVYFEVSQTVFYTNGMTTDVDAAKKACRKIAKETGATVRLHHNDTTPTSTPVWMVAKVVLGLFGFHYASKIEDKKAKRLAQGSSVLSVGSALYDYADVQAKKNASARVLSRKIVKCLQANPHGEVTLVLHSQGADIGQRALQMLNKYKQRINVMTVGGMVTIPDRLAKKVVNVQNEGDIVSRMASTIFSKSGNYTRPLVRQSGHSAKEYLNSPIVQQHLREMATPTFHGVESSGG